MFKQIKLKNSALEKLLKFYTDVFHGGQDVITIVRVGDSYVLTVKAQDKVKDRLHIQKLNEDTYTAHSGAERLKDILITFLSIICEDDEYEVKQVGDQ